MNRQTEIVVTTIFEPNWLPGYLANLRRNGQASCTRISIITDQKTPASVYAAAAEAAQAGFQIWCPSLHEQEQFLQRLGAPADLVPWNTDNRRNIGFLAALERGAEVLISIDDDNYCRDEEDFVASHGVVGHRADQGDALATGARWFNLCSLLEHEPAAAIYPRGLPYAARKLPMAGLRAHSAEPACAPRIALNAGLWLDDPDVDAITRLSLSPKASAARIKNGVVLAAETWSPINTQNTAVMGAAIPAYYYPRMGYSLRGLHIDRYGDILSGYFIQKCIKQLGDGIRIGSPTAVHRRTPHNLFKDLYHELAGMVLVEDLLPWLIELPLQGSDYRETYAALADALDAQAASFKGFVWDDGGREFLRETAGCMRTWLAMIARWR